MSFLNIFSRFFILASLAVCFWAETAVASPSVSRAVSESENRYSHAHSLGDSYAFNARDGWQTVNVSNLPYKYEPSKLEKRKAHKKLSGIGGIGKAISDAIKGLKGIGKPEKVAITWYAHHYSVF